MIISKKYLFIPKEIANKWLEEIKFFYKKGNCCIVLHTITFKQGIKYREYILYPKRFRGKIIKYIPGIHGERAPKQMPEMEGFRQMGYVIINE